MFTAILIYYLAHVGTITAAPATVNILAAASIVETASAYNRGWEDKSW